jgi:hypothetical protein
MRGDRVCVGAHDLADFKSLRLYRHDGTYLTTSDNVSVGQTWDLTYRPKPDTVPPHVEDVIVEREGANRIGREQNLAALIQQRDTVWQTPAQLFEGRLQFTAAGSAYVPAGGPLPSRSTGYWLLDAPLFREEYDGKTRYVRDGADGLRRIGYVGTAATRATIAAGTLVRLSLSRRFAPTAAHDGYWLQLSGWY